MSKSTGYKGGRGKGGKGKDLFFYLGLAPVTNWGRGRGKEKETEDGYWKNSARFYPRFSFRIERKWEKVRGGKKSDRYLGKKSTIYTFKLGG